MEIKKQKNDIIITDNCPLDAISIINLLVKYHQRLKIELTNVWYRVYINNDYVYDLNGVTTPVDKKILILYPLINGRLDAINRVSVIMN